MASNKNKVWRVSNQSKAGMMVTGDTAFVVGDEKHFIATGPTGTTIAGPLNIMTTSENIRNGGLFVEMNDFIKMIPGTIVTPIPSQIPFPPIAMFAYVALALPGILALVK